MAKPIAKFKLVPTGLSVKFTDLSANVPITFAWDFGGDGTSTAQNPTKLFTTAGKFLIKLTVTNADGSDEHTVEIIVSGTENVLPLSVGEMAVCKIPVRITIDENCQLNSIRKWQVFLQILVDPKIADADVFDETKWPTLVNALISELICYDLILDAFQRSTLQNTIGPDGSSARNQLKKLVTGPSEAEWFNNSDYWNNIFKEGGAFEEVLKTICSLAARLRIQLPMCDPITHDPFIYDKATRPPVVDLPFPFTNPPNL